jgi:hypothetical protein
LQRRAVDVIIARNGIREGVSEVTCLIAIVLGNDGLALAVHDHVGKTISLR